MADILKRVEELSDLFDNTGSEKLEFNSGGRVNLYEAGLVKRGLRKGEYFVDTDPREYFKTEKLANKYIKDIKEGKFRKTAAGDKFLTGAEFKKLYRKFKSGTDAEFAKLLNDRGFLTSTGAPFNAESVESRRSRLGIKSKSPNQNISNRSILKQAREMKLDIKGKSIDQIRRSVLESRSLEKGKTAEELKKLRDFRERKVLMAGKERQFPFNIGKKPDPKKVFWRDLLDNAQRHQAFVLNRPGAILPESHIKFQNINQVRPTDVKSVFDIKLIDSNVIDPKTGKPKVLTYDNFLKHIDDNQRLYRIDSKTALQEYKKKRFIQENFDLRDKFNQKLNKAYDPTSRTSRAIFSPMHIHHTAGRGRNAFNVQFAVGTENMRENALRRAFNKNFAKAKTFGQQRAALKKYLDSVPPNLEVRLKNTPYGQRETLIDMTRRVAPELEKQVRAAGGARLGAMPLLDPDVIKQTQFVKDIKASPTVLGKAGKVGGKFLGPFGFALEGYFAKQAYDEGRSIPEVVASPFMLEGVVADAQERFRMTKPERQAVNIAQVANQDFSDLSSDFLTPIIPGSLDVDVDAVRQRTGEAEAAERKLRALQRSGLKEQSRKEVESPLYAAGGGIAGLSGGIDMGPQVKSMNPDSQGLQGLMKRGIKT